MAVRKIIVIVKTLNDKHYWSITQMLFLMRLKQIIINFNHVMYTNKYTLEFQKKKKKHIGLLAHPKKKKKINIKEESYMKMPS